MKAISIFGIILLVQFASYPASYKPSYQADNLHTVDVDKRMELYFITAYLSESFFKRWLSINDANYAREIEEYFSAYKSHPAITFFEETWKPDMSFYIPPEIMLYLSSELKEQKDIIITQEILDHIGGIDKKNEFISKIRDFADVTNYNEFYSQHHDYYESLRSKIQDLLEKRNCIQTLSDFYGTTMNHYYVLLVPLLGQGNGYGPSIAAQNKKTNVYCLFSPYQADDVILNQLWHEFGHSFVNPVAAKNTAHINESEALYKPIESLMNPLYPNWENSLCEHLVRVNTTELIKNEFGKQKAEQLISNHENQGFIYMSLLTKLIKTYESQRRKYPTFESYLPHILNKLNKIDPTDYQPDDDGIFNGPLNAVTNDVSYIIIPTNEQNDSIEENIRKYCTHIQNFLQEHNNSTIRIITDREALESDISGGDLLVYGTINGNIWLNTHIQEFPFKIDAEKIIADKVYTGNNLRFMSAWPHFQNKSRGMSIYTAQRAEDIWGINGINHGNTDYIIVKGDNEEGSGNYKKKDEKWDFK